MGFEGQGSLGAGVSWAYAAFFTHGTLGTVRMGRRDADLEHAQTNKKSRCRFSSVGLCGTVTDGSVLLFQCNKSISVVDTWNIFYMHSITTFHDARL